MENEKWYIETGGTKHLSNGQDVFTRNNFISINDFDDSIKEQYDNKDYYASIFMYDNLNIEEALLDAPFYLDLDNPNTLTDEQAFFKVKRDTILCINTLNSIYKIPIKMIRIYFSGAKGFHLIIPQEVFGIEPHQKLNMVYYEMAKELKKHILFGSIDLRYDSRRLFRMNNSINSKTGLYKVPISYEDLVKCNLKFIQEYASSEKEIDFEEPCFIEKANQIFLAFKEAVMKPKNKNRTKYNGYFDTLMPCVLKALDEGATHGNRNNTSVALASYLFQTGMTYDKVEETLLEWNNTKNVPKLTDKEIKDTVKSANKEMDKGFRYGCTKMKEFGYCDPGKCGVIQ